MQQIERVGVIALLLMVVTIVVVALWDDNGESSAQVSTSNVEEPDKKETKRAKVASGERGATEDGLRSTRAGARQRMTAPIGASTPAPTRGDGSIPRTTGRRAPREDPVRLRESERSRGAEVALSVPDPEPEPARTAPARTERGPVADGIEFGTRRRNETRKPPRNDVGARPVSTVRPEPARPVAAAAGTYVVKPGDSLERIARRVLGKGSRWPEIQALNGGIDPLKVNVGMKLKLPSEAQGGGESARGGEPTRVAGAKEEAQREPASTGAVASDRTYVVKAGDILGRISQRELGSARYWRQIVELNPKVNPDRLLVGARLVLPDVGEAPASRAPRNLVAQADARVDSTFRVR